MNVQASSYSQNDFDHLVYVRLTEACNLHCEHCFIPATPKQMSINDFKKIPQIVQSFASPNDNVLLQWHGGEPTIFGIKRLIDAIETIQSSNVPIHWKHGIQTNLINYNADWGDLFSTYFNRQIGVSWDPDIRFLNSKKSDVVAYENKFQHNLKSLIADGVEPTLVMTGTRVFFEKFKHPFKLFEWLVDHDIKLAHIERLTKTGHAINNWHKLGVDNAEYSRYMSRLYRGYIQWNQNNTDNQVSLSPFDGLQRSVSVLKNGIHKQAGYGCWSGGCDNRFHTIDATGYQLGCTALTSNDDSSAPWVQLNYNELRVQRKAPCQHCEFQKICSTGCFATSYEDASGECSGAKNLFKTIEQNYSNNE
ncbi:MAG: radical SAM protein [Methylococcales bacterium]|nr:radical SAM protein [Methylococcales bacterium]